MLKNITGMNSVATHLLVQWELAHLNVPTFRVFHEAGWQANPFVQTVGLLEFRDGQRALFVREKDYYFIQLARPEDKPSMMREHTALASQTMEDMVELVFQLDNNHDGAIFHAYTKRQPTIIKPGEGPKSCELLAQYHYDPDYLEHFPAPECGRQLTNVHLTALADLDRLLTDKVQIAQLQAEMLSIVDKDFSDDDRAQKKEWRLKLAKKFAARISGCEDCLSQPLYMVEKPEDVLAELEWWMTQYTPLLEKTQQLSEYKKQRKKLEVLRGQLLAMYAVQHERWNQTSTTVGDTDYHPNPMIADDRQARMAQYSARMSQIYQRLGLGHLADAHKAAYEKHLSCVSRASYREVVTRMVAQPFGIN
jgi:hypothetical protein